MKPTTHYAHWLKQSWMLALSLALVCSLAIPSIAHAQTTITVDTTADEFDGLVSTGCSLREAIQAANTGADFGGCSAAGGAPYTISVPAGLYTLMLGGNGEDDNAEGDLDISTSLTIVGAGADTTIIQAGLAAGAGIDRIFHLTDAVDVSISGVTVQNGNTEDGGSGGAILADPGSTLTVADSTLANNVSDRAGGAIELSATVTGTVGVTLTDVIMSDNSTGDVPGNGGALHTTGPGTVSVTGGAVTGNSAAAEGGGLWNSAVGTMTISGTMVMSNTASGDMAVNGGGGLYNDGGTMTVTNATISGNVADGDSGSGGGILVNAGSVFSATASTIDGNSVQPRGRRHRSQRHDDGHDVGLARRRGL